MLSIHTVSIPNFLSTSLWKEVWILMKKSSLDKLLTSLDCSWPYCLNTRIGLSLLSSAWSPILSTQKETLLWSFARSLMPSMLYWWLMLCRSWRHTSAVRPILSTLFLTKSSMVDIVTPSLSFVAIICWVQSGRCNWPTGFLCICWPHTSTLTSPDEYFLALIYAVQCIPRFDVPWISSPLFPSPLEL